MFFFVKEELKNLSRFHFTWSCNVCSSKQNTKQSSDLNYASWKSRRIHKEFI